jgi:hypothetical protein
MERWPRRIERDLYGMALRSTPATDGDQHCKRGVLLLQPISVVSVWW